MHWHANTLLINLLCLVGDACTIKTLGAIKHDKSVRVKTVMNKDTKQLVSSNLHFKYNICVDPKNVSFGVHPTNDFGLCDTGTSLSSVVSTSWTEKAVENGKQTADLTLKIDNDNLNAKKLGKAYSLSNGESKVALCVRARVKEGDEEILSTEYNVNIKYSMQIAFSISPKSVIRDSNDEVTDDLGVISQNNEAYQCDEEYQKIISPAPLSLHSNILRVCIEGESDAFKCENIVSVTLKQKDIADNQLITDGIPSGKFTKQSSKGQICMLTTLILPKYFAKKDQVNVHTYVHKLHAHVQKHEHVRSYAHAVIANGGGKRLDAAST